MLDDLHGQRFSIIYADPPWAFQTYRKGGTSRSAEMHYPCMDLASIKAMPVAELAAEDCCLFMWASDPMLPQALEVMAAWGFTFKTVAFTWAKTTARGNWHFGGGYWTRCNPEMVLLGTRGAPKRASASVRQLVVAPVREHSRKPDDVRDRIVALCGDVPRLELFARSAAPGWTSWGNEVGRFA